MRKLLSIVLTICILILAVNYSVSSNTNSQIKLLQNLEWEPLNPARGNKSPMAATLWGDRNGSLPTGFLVKFVDGFSSPPHIHNVTYRGLVINGHIHNDDPSAQKMWMPSGSFWIQPAGEVHITAARGDANLAYIEIDNGPYLVRPKEDSFDNGERPLNVAESNIVWINQGEASGSVDIELAYLWGMPHSAQSYGLLVKIPAGKTVKINSEGPIFHAVIIKGKIRYQSSKTTNQMMVQGDYFNAENDFLHSIVADEESIIYVHTNGGLNIDN